MLYRLFGFHSPEEKLRLKADLGKRIGPTLAITVLSGLATGDLVSSSAPAP